MSDRSTQCRSCKPPYTRTDDHNAKMSAKQTGKPKLKLRGRKRPDHAVKMREYWADQSKRDAAKVRGKALAGDPAWRLKIAELLSGDKNPRWRGGMSKTKYAPGFGRSLKRRIRVRDKYTCQLCGQTEFELGCHLSIHHADYDKTNHDESNLFATCKACNSRVNTNRDIWIGYFVALANMRSQFGKNVSNLVCRQVVTQREGFASVIALGPDTADLQEFAAYFGTLVAP